MVNYQELKKWQIVYYYEYPMVYEGFNPVKNCVILSDLTMGFNRSKRISIHISHMFNTPTKCKGNI